jgi:hypothetical protein
MFIGAEATKSDDNDEEDDDDDDDDDVNPVIECCVNCERLLKFGLAIPTLINDCSLFE